MDGLKARGAHRCEAETCRVHAVAMTGGPRAARRDYHYAYVTVCLGHCCATVGALWFMARPGVRSGAERSDSLSADVIYIVLEHCA